MHIKDPKLIPDHVKRMIAHSERVKLGIKTNEEQQERVDDYNERKLHGEICQLLNLKGIAYCHARMDKKSRMTKGWPDFTFAVGLSSDGVGISTVPCAWECKVGKGQLSLEQEEMRIRMISPPNAWRCRVIHSLKEAADELKELGI